MNLLPVGVVFSPLFITFPLHSLSVLSVVFLYCSFSLLFLVTFHSHIHSSFSTVFHFSFTFNLPLFHTHDRFNIASLSVLHYCFPLQLFLITLHCSTYELSSLVISALFFTLHTPPHYEAVSCCFLVILFTT